MRLNLFATAAAAAALAPAALAQNGSIPDSVARARAQQAAAAIGGEAKLREVRHEMADVLGISESNVGVKLNRAKKALSALMNEESHGS